MTDDPKRKPIGSPIDDFKKLGRKRSEVQHSERTDMQQSESSDTQNATSSDFQTSRLPESQQSTSSGPQTAEASKVQTSRSSDVETVSSSKVIRSKHPEWKQKTIYLPPKLAHQLNVHAAQAELEISEIMAMALREYLERHS